MHWETYNSVNGTTNNPYDFRKTPGGSSGGVGALVSSAASIFGLGNDLGGSVRIPAFMCGIFGLKPTAGIVPLDGMVPEVTIGYEMANNRLQLNRDVDFKKVKVFCMEELNILVHEPLQIELRQSVRNVAKYFEKTFNVDVVHINLPIAHHTFELWGAFKFGDDAPDSYGESIQKLSHCFNDSSDETILGAISTGKRDKLKQQICNLLGEDGILLFPAFCSTAPYHKQGNFTPFNNSYPTLFNALGLPSLACPLGLNPKDGMPLGIQVVGPAYSEGLLIAVGKELEKGFGGWTPPGNI
uniref:Amidase domain-containing protein n=1 Tax=Ditylenchus dipsaci TaxID=166011 RepID=A0A915CM91_9BILA